ncbi:hypothetical protein [Mycolicibacterium mucogenicum]|uniref:Uncharacterized protein n=1 Tax=Mycolicibacterium mucogenicum TaxID=56689 RepID=A0A4R5W8J0_MYCMU|nr:hypothetical protein [Mycolicibacterium mucogenicum]TDK85161.1 hypothetical protein EUA03_23645 [Mycolicibacterium mucogenicum]
MPVAAAKQSTILVAWNDAATGSWRLSPRPHRGERRPLKDPQLNASEKRARCDNHQKHGRAAETRYLLNNSQMA